MQDEYKQNLMILVLNICDLIAGITNTYAINEYNHIENYSQTHTAKDIKDIRKKQNLFDCDLTSVIAKSPSLCEGDFVSNLF